MFNWLEYYAFARKQLSLADTMPKDETSQKEAMLMICRQ